MKILWRVPLCGINNGEDCSLFNFYDTAFFNGNSAVWFYDGYVDGLNNLFASVIDLNDGKHERFSIEFAKGEGVPTPANWEITERDGGYFIDPFKYYVKLHSYVGVMKDGKLEFVPEEEKEDTRVKNCLFFNGKTIDICGASPNPEKKIYSDAKVYKFGNLRVDIAKKSTRKLECVDTQTNTVLWTFKFTGYLYTDIVEYDGVIFFGTAGQGGHFYGLNLADGATIHDVNTHGTVNFVKYGNKFYFLSEHAELQEYDIITRTSEILGLEKYEIINDYADLHIRDGKMYAVIAKRLDKKTYLYDYYLACIQL